MFVRAVVKLLQYLFSHFVMQHQVNWFSGHFVGTLKQILLQNTNRGWKSDSVFSGQDVWTTAGT